MKAFDETIQTIFELKSTMEHVLFKEFLQNYDLPKGVNHTHMRTMMMLKFNGSTPMSEVSHMLNLEKGSFTPVANKLIKLNLVIKEQSVTDKRVFNLSLTTEGETFAREFGASHQHYLQRLFDSLGNKQRQKFFESADLMNTTLLNLAQDNNQINNSCKNNESSEVK